MFYLPLPAEQGLDESLKAYLFYHKGLVFELRGSLAPQLELGNRYGQTGMLLVAGIRDPAAETH